jgi:hypothetical protein
VVGPEVVTVGAAGSGFTLIAIEEVEEVHPLILVCETV